MKIRSNPKSKSSFYFSVTLAHLIGLLALRMNMELGASLSPSRPFFLLAILAPGAAWPLWPVTWDKVTSSASLTNKAMIKAAPETSVLIPPAAIWPCRVQSTRALCFMMAGSITCYWSALSLITRPCPPLVIVWSPVGSSWQRDIITVTFMTLASQLAPCPLWHLRVEHHSTLW